MSVRSEILNSSEFLRYILEWLLGINDTFNPTCL